MTYEQIIQKLKSLYNPKNVEGMARFGINPENTLGISVNQIRKLAKEIGRDHSLAVQLWDSGIHEARILASIIDEPEKVTEKQMDKWVKEFDSWDVCDQVCMNVFENSEFAVKKTIEWSLSEKEFIKRAGFSLIARLAVSDKKSGDELFENFFPIIIRESTDERNYVKKSVNWALRQIGKRNLHLNRLALETAKKIQKLNFKSAKWIASDVIRELTNGKIIDQLKKQNKK